MRSPAANPRAIVAIERPQLTDGQSLVEYNSWDAPRLIKSIDVEFVTNATSECEISVFDPEFKVIDTFAGTEPLPQSIVRVFMGYGPRLGTPVFKGLLAEVTREQENTKLVVFDMGFKMKLEKRAGYKNRKDDLGIIRDFAKRNGLKFEGPETPLSLEPHRAMMQDEETDWNHAMDRARDAGLVLFVREDTLFAKYPAKVGIPALTLTNRKDFVMKAGWDFTFHTPESLDGRPKVVRRRGRDKGGKRIEGESDTATRGRESLVLKKDVPGKATKSKLSKRAQAQKELDREHAFIGRVETLYPMGGKRVDVRDTVMVKEVGKLFSGAYICDSVTYKFAAGELGMCLDLFRDVAEKK